MDIETGIFYNMAMSDYARHPAVSRTQLHRLLRYSPQHMLIDQSENEAMALGTLAHMASLQYDLFINTHIPVEDSVRRNSKAWGETQERWPTATLIKQSEMDVALAMADALRNHAVVGDLLAEGQPEVTAIWQDDETNEYCKVRADWLRPNDKLIIDIKTARDPRSRAFTRACGQYGYYLQEAMYLEGFSTISPHRYDGFLFVVVESSPPYGIQIYDFDSQTHAYAYDQFRQGLKRYHECRQANKFPGYDQGLQTITLPSYLIEDHDDD